jgi:hypothetical protein
VEPENEDRDPEDQTDAVEIDHFELTASGSWAPSIRNAVIAGAVIAAGILGFLIGRKRN